MSARHIRVAVAMIATVAATLASIPTPAGAVTNTYTASADAEVRQAKPTTNYGGSRKLGVDGSPEIGSFVRFDVTGMEAPVTRATLRVRAVSSTVSGPAIYPTAGAWSESDITWANRPERLATDPLGLAGSVTSDTWVAYDVTAVVPGNGTYSFELAGSSDDGVEFASREARSGAPELVVETGATQPPPPPPPGDGGIAAYAPTDDARVDVRRSDTNYGSATSLEVDGAPAQESYLRFAVPEVPGSIASARLRLFVTDPTVDGPTVQPAATNWTEQSLTWATRPEITAGPLGDAGALNRNTWLEFDVSGAVAGSGPVAFALVATGNDGVAFRSKEASSSRPELIVTWGGPTTTTTSTTTTSSSTTTTSSSTTTTSSSTTTTSSPTTTTTGPPPPPGDSGTSAFDPTDDATVKAGNPGTNFGSAQTLEVDGSPIQESYLQFSVNGLPGRVTGGRLRLYVTNGSPNGPAVRPVETGWSEGQLTYANRPSATGSPTDNLAAVSAGTWVTLDVTPAVTGNGVVAFGLSTEASDGTDFASKESTTSGKNGSSNRPLLLVDWTTADDTQAPDTVFTQQDFTGKMATFGFSADEPVSRYECRFDGGSFAACAGPVIHDGLAEGWHVFEVRAVDLAGLTDPTPARRRFNVGTAALREGRLAPAAGALFGTHVQVSGSLPAADQQALLEGFEAQIGRTMAIDHYYQPWGTIFPTWRETFDLDGGRIPMISWGTVKSTDVIAGTYDAYIRDRADGIRNLGQDVFVRWFWEMDGSRKADSAVSPAAYIAAWRHIHSIFQERGADNAVWVWCPNATAFRDGDGQPFYPGDDVVDWVCADGYNFYPDPERSYETFEEKFIPFHDWAVAQGKPAMAGEWGSQAMEPGRRADWIADVAQSHRTRLPGLLGSVYFHSLTSEHDWRLTPEPDALAAYRTMGLDPYFNPSVP